MERYNFAEITSGNDIRRKRYFKRFHLLPLQYLTYIGFTHLRDNFNFNVQTQATNYTVKNVQAASILLQACLPSSHQADISMRSHGHIACSGLMISCNKFSR